MVSTATANARIGRGEPVAAPNGPANGGGAGIAAAPAGQAGFSVAAHVGDDQEGAAEAGNGMGAAIQAGKKKNRRGTRGAKDREAVLTALEIRGPGPLM